MSGGSKLKQGAGGLAVLLLAAAAGLLLALSPDIATPLAVLLLPGLIALMLDKSLGCGVARAILLCQAAACVHPVADAWYQCSGIDGCMRYLADWRSILSAWLAAAAAWVMTQVLPLALKILNDQRLKHRRTTLLARRVKLIDEWGLGERAD